MAKKPKSSPDHRIILQNRKAYYNYEIIEKLEAGIVLQGSEVKALRGDGKASIAESYASHEKGAVMLINAYIPEYGKAGRFNHNPRRHRKLLLHQREIKKLIGLLKTKGLTLVPLSLYFNKRNLAKVEIALVKGKKTHDKRATEKDRDWEREKGRIMREK